MPDPKHQTEPLSLNTTCSQAPFEFLQLCYEDHLQTENLTPGLFLLLRLWLNTAPAVGPLHTNHVSLFPGPVRSYGNVLPLNSVSAHTKCYS